MFQKTIKRQITFSGIGIHSGLNSEVALMPAPENTGIVFLRTDIPSPVPLPAVISQVSSNTRSTTIGTEPNQVKTIEHLLAAARAFEIDNLNVQINGPELPIFDGSAAQYVNLFEQAGIAEQTGKRKIIELEHPVWFSHKDSIMIALPHNQLEVVCCIDFPHPLVKAQFFSYSLEKISFGWEIARCRTFGFIEEVQALLDKQLALGGSLDNAIIVYPDHYSSPLHFPNELVRHKILDIIGDLYLLGAPLKAKIIAIKPSHSLNHALVKEIVNSKEAKKYAEY